MSASISPFFTWSPTFLCQAAITPSVIVSLRRGIRITSCMEDKSSPDAEAVLDAGADAATLGCEAAAAVAAGAAGAADATGATVAAGAVDPPVFNRVLMSSPGFPIIASKSLT